MQSTDWAEEHSKALREFLQSGMSYSRIADAINAKFKTAYSRNATIGRAKRMGLPGPDRPRNWPKPTLSAEALRLHRLRERLASESSRPMPALESVEPVDLCCVEINPRRLSLLDLEPGRLPLSLRRRRGGRGHHLLRSPAAPGHELLCRAFLPDARARRRTGTTRRHRLPQAGGGGMKRGRKPTPAIMIIRMKRLPRRHRIAHLRALIPQQPAHSIRREELVALLRDEMWARPVEETRAM
jgi:GcrA cell cycle regulator